MKNHLRRAARHHSPESNIPADRSGLFARATAAPTCAGLLLIGSGHTLGKPEMLVANLADLTLEQLSNIQITSVSKHPERLSDAAALVFVISAEDIRRSGASTLNEALVSGFVLPAHTDLAVSTAC